MPRVPGLKKESDVIKRLRDNARLCLPGLVSFKIHSGIYSGNIGFPDLIFLYNSQALFLEAKSGSNLTLNQIATIKQMRQTKTNVWVVRPTKTYPVFMFSTPIKSGEILEVLYDISLKDVWVDIFNGPDRETMYMKGRASIRPGELK
jgi:hypothetical protein